MLRLFLWLLRIQKEIHFLRILILLFGSLLREAEVKHLKLQSDLVTLPRMSRHLTFEENKLNFIKLWTFPASRPEYVDSTFHTIWGMRYFYL